MFNIFKKKKKVYNYGRLINQPAVFVYCNNCELERIHHITIPNCPYCGERKYSTKIIRIFTEKDYKKIINNFTNKF